MYVYVMFVMSGMTKLTIYTDPRKRKKKETQHCWLAQETKTIILL